MNGDEKIKFFFLLKRTLVLFGQCRGGDEKENKTKKNWASKTDSIRCISLHNSQSIRSALFPMDRSEILLFDQRRNSSDANSVNSYVLFSSLSHCYSRLHLVSIVACSRMNSRRILARRNYSMNYNV